MAEKRKIGKIIALFVVVLALGGLFYLEEMTFGLLVFRNPFAKPLLRQLAKSDNFEIKTRAADALMEMASADDLDYYINVIKDPESNDYILDDAVIALRIIGDPRAAGQIRPIYQNTSRYGTSGGENLLWRDSFLALAKLQRENFCPEILEVLKDDNFSVKLVAISALPYCNEDIAIDNIKNIISSTIKSQDERAKSGSLKSDSDIDFQLEYTQQTAIAVLYKINSLKTVDAAIELLNSGNPYIGESALQVLRHFATGQYPELKPKLKSIIIAKLAPNNHFRIRGEALNILFDLYNTQESYEIIKMYENDPELGVLARDALQNLEIKRRAEEWGK